MGITAIRFGISEGTKEEMMKYGVGGLGAFMGLGISEFTGEFITTYADLTKGKKTAVKVLVRLLLFGAFFGLSLYVPAGWITWLVAGAGVGAFAGVFYDLYGYFMEGGFAAAGQKAALSFKGGSFR